MLKSHKCKALVISCIDFRFVGRIRNFLESEQLMDNYDLITVPGASLNLSKIDESIATSFKLHDPDSIYLFDHEDCGAYGNNNSKRAHTESLVKAKKVLSEQHPEKSVKTFIAGFDHFEEII